MGNKQRVGRKLLSDQVPFGVLSLGIGRPPGETSLVLGHVDM